MGLAKYCVLFVGLFLSLSASASKIDSIDLNAITSVGLHIYDSQRHLQDASKSKFIINIFVNGLNEENYVTSYVVSPGVLTSNPLPGREPELTPEGWFHPTPGRLYKKYVSGQFGQKVLGIFETGNMPFSIFFHSGFAIHGSRATVDGTPASKGCVRMKVRQAEKVFRLVQAAIQNTGGDYTSVQIKIEDTEADYVARFRRKQKASPRQSVD